MRWSRSSAQPRGRGCCTGWVEAGPECAYLMRKENGDEPSRAIRRPQEADPEKADQRLAESRTGRRGQEARHQRQRSLPARPCRRGKEEPRGGVERSKGQQWELR